MPYLFLLPAQKYRIVENIHQKIIKAANPLAKLLPSYNNIKLVNLLLSANHLQPQK